MTGRVGEESPHPGARPFPDDSGHGRRDGHVRDARGVPALRRRNAARATRRIGDDYDRAGGLQARSAS